MALTKPIWIRPNWSQIGREKRRERGEEQKERRRGTGRGRREAKIKRYGTTWTFNALNGSPCLYSY